MKTIALFLSTLIFPLCMAGPSADQHPPQHQATIASPLNAKWWRDTQQQINSEVAKGDVDLIFIGDSIIHWFRKMPWHNETTCGINVWRDYYAKRNAVNAGIMADKTQHVLWRLENGNLKGISPKLAVVMIGTNNVAHQESPQETADGVNAIIASIHAHCPTTKVLLLAIFPRGKELNDKARTQNDKVNKIIATYSQTYPFLTYLDIGNVFLNKDGTVNKDLLHDHLHPNAKGYKAWAEAIEPTIEKLMQP